MISNEQKKIPIAYEKFQLPLNFSKNIRRDFNQENRSSIESLDLQLIESIFEPRLHILEWMFNQGELVSCSLEILCNLLPLDNVQIQRKDIPLPLRQVLEDAIDTVSLCLDLNRSEIFQHWNVATVPNVLIPSIKALSKQDLL